MLWHVRSKLRIHLLLFIVQAPVLCVRVDMPVVPLLTWHSTVLLYSDGRCSGMCSAHIE